jgi:hypothetical protein
MRNYYEVGRVYVWQGLKTPIFGHLNGTETTVTGDIMLAPYVFQGGQGYGQPTDTILPNGMQAVARPGQLRPKDPPPGEQSVLDLFKTPEPEHA